MARTRQAKMPVDSSWRMVEEGENDSFDTTVIQDPYDEDFLSSQSQVSSASQGLGSQDSIRDFADKADEDQVILRAPFHPSFVSTRHTSVDKERTPVPEFFMPTVEVNSSEQSSGGSSRTVRSAQNETTYPRRRVLRRESTEGSTRKLGYGNQAPAVRRRTQEPNGESPRPTLSDRFTSSAPELLFDILAWILSVIGMALRFSKWPIAIMVAVYLCIGAAIVGKNMVTQSISASLTPICRIPGASFMNLPFCPDGPSTTGLDKNGGSSSVEFDELMDVQSQFEKVLEDSASGVSLPMEMKRSETSVRDLRTMVKYSDLPSRDELVYEFDGYIDSVRQISTDLQSFNTHVGSAVDSVISINRWTSRYIDSIAISYEANDNLLSRSVNWLFSPFQPAVFNERMVLDKYIEHTALVSDKIAGLILEAQATLRLLSQAEDHLQLINENVVRSGNTVKEKRSEVFWDIWTLLGANNRRLHNLKAQLSLLRQVETQRNSAVTQLMSLVHDLGDIQTKLSDLRDRVAAPELLADTTTIPLSVHIETINAGVERLEEARSRIRAEENERLQQALARAREEDRLIEG
ncbi:hypothetical protein F5Y16DRAFT_413253 [Xylariaceae sp. FL0255]|nr:hypothetical protein F5Y16DRAFT_413253 [Xylariaceae sp. FL0255]